MNPDKPQIDPPPAAPVGVSSQPLFRVDDELTFKRQYVIQFLAALDAENYRENCMLGWKRHRPAVEDARHLADKAWEEWQDTIGLVG